MPEYKSIRPSYSSTVDPTLLDYRVKKMISIVTEKFRQQYPNNKQPEWDSVDGRKYIRIFRIEHDGTRSIWCFINPQTGAVLKPASWKGPAKGVRYNIMDDTSYETMCRRIDPHGSFLYNY